MQQRSEDYWRESTDTFLGASDYYDRRAAVLEKHLTTWGPWQRGIDIGCGTGRFTMQAAAHVERMEGTDIGPALIEAAQQHAGDAGMTNVEYRVADALAPLEAGAYDLVMALGFTSCLTDDQVFTDALTLMHDALKPGGTLITVDSLTFGSDRLASFDSGYVARYRNEWEYRAAIKAVGFSEPEEVPLGTPSSNRLVRALPILQQNHNTLFRFVRAL